jgi:hypothetical protein
MAYGAPNYSASAMSLTDLLNAPIDTIDLSSPSELGQFPSRFDLDSVSPVDNSLGLLDSFSLGAGSSFSSGSAASSFQSGSMGQDKSALEQAYLLLARRHQDLQRELRRVLVEYEMLK